ncbi:MAG: hypothetical protein GF364_15200 [Candidatus Lokiarchaeota archaeon]|nr:hypothetical protein [Candidatus Lokiarchaeota archaeon]
MKDNYEVILEYLRHYKGSCRSEIVKSTGIPRTTVYDNLFRMLEKDIVEKEPQNNGKGRPLTIWRIK